MESEGANSSDQPKWLNQIQSRTWEAELLISGGAIVSLFQIFDYLSIQFQNIDRISRFLFNSVFVLAGIKFLMVYFSLHLFARSFWLSLIFLQKIYPKGIDIERLKLAEPFRLLATRLDVSKWILNLDKYCSLLFSWSINMVLIWIGIFLSFSVVFFPRSMAVAFFHEPLVNKHVPPSSYFAIPLLVTLLIYFFDTFIYGVLRRSRFLAKFYYPIYLFWNTIGIGFLWRPIFQLIFSNVKSKWKASLTVFGLFLVGLFFTGDTNDFLSLLDSRKYTTSVLEINETRYADKNSGEGWVGSTIQSEIITDEYIQVFVPYNDTDDSTIDSLRLSKKYFSDIINLSLDDSALTNVKWIGIHKTNLQKGIHTVVAISDLRNGLHTLKIKRKFDKDSAVAIPFWKQ